jgi:hypothetical protein
MSDLFHRKNLPVSFFTSDRHMVLFQIDTLSCLLFAGSCCTLCVGLGLERLLSNGSEQGGSQRPDHCPMKSALVHSL